MAFRAHGNTHLNLLQLVVEVRARARVLHAAVAVDAQEADGHGLATARGIVPGLARVVTVDLTEHGGGNRALGRKRVDAEGRAVGEGGGESGFGGGGGGGGRDARTAYGGGWRGGRRFARVWVLSLLRFTCLS
jgi:hypothetical protein